MVKVCGSAVERNREKPALLAVSLLLFPLPLVFVSPLSLDGREYVSVYTVRVLLLK